jgi:RNA polymerase sigma-70 factor (ECF subfamily)
VRQALQKLRENDRVILIAFYFDDCSIREIAEQYGVPIGTVKRRLFTARGRLKEEMRQYENNYVSS